MHYYYMCSFNASTFLSFFLACVERALLPACLHHLKTSGQECPLHTNNAQNESGFSLWADPMSANSFILDTLFPQIENWPLRLGLGPKAVPNYYRLA